VRAWISIGALVLVAGICARGEWRGVKAELGTARDLHGVGYVGSVACRRCHAEHYASWGRTFHRSMTAEATPASVRGDFSGATLQSDGVTARMDRDARGGYRMTFQRAGQAPRVVTVVRTVGSRRYQQYLAREGDSYWRLPVAYQIEEQRWFPMTSAFLFSDPEPSSGAALSTVADGRPVFGGGDFDRHVARWNDNCVFCHNVAPNPGRDPVSGSFATSVAELGVACEACHGPGAEHASRNADPARRYLLYAAPRADPTIVNPSRLSPERSADLCGRCHGQRIADEVEPFLEHGDPFVPGDDLAIESAPLWRDTPLHGDRTAFAARFWRDGTARLTAYEYQGLLQSPCTMRGPLTCTSCHGMHEGDPRGQLRAGFVDDMGTLKGSPNPPATSPAEQSSSGLHAIDAANRMCTGCHGVLAAPGALAGHAHHDPAGAGGSCVGCHMPKIVYGVLDVHRSHRIEVPDPARAAAAGRPDACTGCHVGRTADWAQSAARKFWGGDRYAATAVAGGSAPEEAIFAGEPVARAVAAEALGRAPPLDGAEGRARRLGILLDVMVRDRYPAVRHLAWRGLRRLAAPDPAPVGRPLAAYDPSATPSERAAAVNRLRSALGPAFVDPSPAELAARTNASADRDLEIGE
jgi:Cytochrome c554 and c-prime